MNQQNISKAPELVKRKRGRPRKDESGARNVKPHTQPPLAMAVPPPPQQAAAIFPPSNNVTKVDPNMVGHVVTCVIDGIFDNGYLLSACVGPNNTVLRGIVFQQGHVAPVTPANDVAPHVEMCTRREFPIPPSNPVNPIKISTPEPACANQPAQPVPMQNYQNTPVMVTGGSSSSLRQESITMIQQDAVMQVFEVSKPVEEPIDCDQRAKNEHVVSNPTAENFPETNIIVNKATEVEPVVNEQPAKEPEGEKPEVITTVEAIVENPPSVANDGLQQGGQAQTGEMSDTGANQDQNQEIGVDLSLSNFPEI